MKKMFGMGLLMAATFALGATTEEEIAKLQKQIDRLKVKVGKVNAQSANDYIKWGVDFRTAIDSINYDMADGSSAGKNDLMSMRLWLNMAYAPDSHNVFKGQLSMNKAFGGNFDKVGYMQSMYTFDWIGNEALGDNTLKVRQAYWLYLGDRAFGLDMPWTFSIGRRPSTNGFLANLREDDPAQSPLGHIINVEFDGLSSKLDLSNVTGIPGMSFKICMGQGSTNATPMFASNGAPQYSNDDTINEDIRLAGFIFEPYNDGQIISKITWFRAYDLPDLDLTAAGVPTGSFSSVGNMDGAALSVLIDGITEDGYFSDVKVFGSFAWSKSRPNGSGINVGGVNIPGMMGSTDSKTGTSYWFGTQLPVTEDGKFGVEYNHGSQYWRPFDYAEDTMIGSKLAARGDAWEVYFTYQLTDALSAQARYTRIDYDYTGSNGFFGNSSGNAMKIADVKAAAANGNAQAQQLLPTIVESADDFRFYIRYRF